MNTQKMTHTTGPWELYEGMDYIHIYGNGEKDDSSLPVAVVTCMEDARLIAAAPTMFDFIAEIAEQECDDLPGEYPEEGESGHAPCLPCRAKALIAKAEGR